MRIAACLLRLQELFGPDRLEATCARALRFDDLTYTTVKRILEQGLDAEELSSPQPVPMAFGFVRTATELVSHLLEGASWR